jgi:alkylation response protein AidB-like acyl-CoA dehydrogenase
MGWIAAALPLDQGGLSRDGLEISTISQELGKALCPAPYLGTALATFLHSSPRSEAAAKTYTDLASGEKTGAWCVAEAGGHVQPDGMSTVARDAAEGFRLTGQKHCVVDGDLADVFVVTAQTAGGPANFAVPASARGVKVDTGESLDLTRAFALVTFDDAAVGEPLTIGDDAAAHADEAFSLGGLLTAAESTGCCERLLQLTVDYALHRIAFGRPVASYQAIKHKCADMLFWLESSRVATRYAALALGTSAFHRGVSVAKSVVGEAAAKLAGESLQIHGGIGYTWEHDLHLFLRRIKANEVLFGDISMHRERLAPSLS